MKFLLNKTKELRNMKNHFFDDKECKWQNKKNNIQMSTNKTKKIRMSS